MRSRLALRLARDDELRSEQRKGRGPVASGKRAHVRTRMQKTTEAEIERRRKEAAKRALEEADIRKRDHEANVLEKELGGRKGPEPTRYSDWEKKGIASDF
jgi:hypothetical protein